MTTSHDDARVLSIRNMAVPKLGFGTWQITGRDCAEGVLDALEIGYRHIDTARAYGNEREVGAGIRAGGVSREELFLTTKIWVDDLEATRVRASAEASLRDLATDYVDLLLVHWPNPAVPLERTLEAMVELRERGLTRELGVSNFPPRLLRQALELAPVFCDQVEFHPFLEQDELLEIAAERDVMITAYSPLAQGKVFGDPTLARIAQEHGTSEAQVALRWLIDHPRVSAIPKSASHANRVANLEALELELSERERAAIDALPKDERDSAPSWGPDWAA
jgi:2,5-diketo-D-gluconate reductase B